MGICFVKERAMRILVVEDERDLNNVICNKLKASGYSVDSCLNGEDALDYIHAGRYDGVLMDIMLPKINGFEVVKRLRAEGDRTPVLFLTARDAVEDIVHGLDIGGNDYLIKPFSFDELLARIRVMVRSKEQGYASVHTLADLRLDSAARTVYRGDTEIELSPKEFALLEYMIINKGKVLSREAIEDHIYDADYEGGSNVVNVYIRFLRRKIDEPFEKKLIHTVRGAGYVLKEE